MLFPLFAVVLSVLLMACTSAFFFYARKRGAAGLGSAGGRCSFSKPSQPLQPSLVGSTPRVSTESTGESSDCSPDARPSKEGVEGGLAQYPVPSFPIIVKDLTNGDDSFRLTPNTREPIPFENDMFVGKVLLKMRSDPMDPYYAPYFEGRRRTFEIQVQGKFKVQPQGTVFMGGEVPAPMSLGFITKNLTRALLSLLKRMSRGLHYSFGDAAGTELPHIVFPITLAMDYMVVTPPGEQPPPLGVQPLPATDHKAIWNNEQRGLDTVNTYSFSFHDMHLDFLKWKITNLPGLRDMDLRLFWGAMPLVLVAYDLPGAPGVPPPERHCLSQRRVFFRFSMENTGGEVTFSSPELGVSAATPTATPTSTPTASSAQLERTESTAVLLPLPGAELDRVRVLPASVRILSLVRRTDSRKKKQVLALVKFTRVDDTAGGGGAQDVMGVAPAAALLRLASKLGDEGGDGPAGMRAPPDLPSIAKAKRVLRMGAPALADICRYLQALLNAAVDAAGADVRAFLLHDVANSTTALTRLGTEAPGEHPKSLPLSDSAVAFSARALCAASPCCFQEGVLLLTSCNSLLFMDTQTASVKLSVGCAHILGFRVLDAASSRKEDMSMLPPCDGWPSFASPAITHAVRSLKRHPPPWGHPGFVFVETPVCALYLYLHSAEGASRLVSALECAVGKARGGTGGAAALSLSADSAWPPEGVDGGRGGYVGEVREGQTILNTKLINFSGSTRTLDPILVSQYCLRAALELARGCGFEPPDVCRLLDAVSLLQLLDLAVLRTDAQKLAFFLNVYHCLFLQAFVLTGLPASVFGRKSFYFDTCYDCGGLLFSLAEIEHCVLKSRLPKAKTFLNFILPDAWDEQHARHSLTLSRPELRVLFVLNSGTQSCLDCIPIFYARDMECQLDMASTAFLSEHVQVHPTKRMVILPKVCEWYKHAFPGKAGMLRFVADLLPPGRRECLAQLLDLPSQSIDVRYASYSWTYHDKFSVLESNKS